MKPETRGRWGFVVGQIPPRFTVSALPNHTSPMSNGAIGATTQGFGRPVWDATTKSPAQPSSGVGENI